MISREQRTPFSEWWWTVDRPLLAAIIALMLGGIILSLAASPPVATRIGLDPFHFFNRHVLFLLPGLHRADRGLVPVAAANSPHRADRVCALDRADRGDALVRSRGQGLAALDHPDRRQHPGFRIRQAGLRGDGGVAVCESARRPEMPATSIALVLLMTLVSLLVMEPDFGQTMLILMVWGALFFIAGMRMIWVLGLAGAATAGLFGAYLLVPHVAGRIKRFMNPASGDTFQVDTAMEAFCQWRLVRAWAGRGHRQAQPAGQPYRLSCSRWRRRNSASSFAWRCSRC
jgi:cell division protein FtsW